MPVQFDEQYSTPIARQPAPKGLAGLLVRSGVVKTPAQANYILLGSAVLLFLVALFVYLSFAQPGSPTEEELSPQVQSEI